MSLGKIEAAGSEIVRFAVYGAAGFGIGAVVSGGSPVLSYFTTGVLGGAALGIALKDWRRTIMLALAGLVGFGVGFTLWFFILALSSRTSRRAQVLP